MHGWYNLPRFAPRGKYAFFRFFPGAIAPPRTHREGWAAVAARTFEMLRNSCTVSWDLQCPGAGEPDNDPE